MLWVTCKYKGQINFVSLVCENVNHVCDIVYFLSQRNKKYVVVYCRDAFMLYIGIKTVIKSRNVECYHNKNF